MPYIRFFRDLTIDDIPSVGGKNASLGEMFSRLTPKGIRVPDGFAVTAEAYWFFIDANGLRARLAALLENLDREQFANLKETGALARKLLLDASLPAGLVEEIRIPRHHPAFRGVRPG